MVEECACCGAGAPRWDAEEYVEWVLELTPEGAYLGVVCPGCFAGEGLAFLDEQPAEDPPLALLRGGAAAPPHDGLPAAA